MDRSESNSAPKVQISVPKRTFSVEFMVGLFSLIGLTASAYLAVGLGELKLFAADAYEIVADFDNVSGLQAGASVEIAGVPIGEVTHINLADPTARVHLHIRADVKIRDDDIASIRTKGIIGDRYVKISRGGSKTFLENGALMMETESVVDIEDIIGKIVHSMTGDKDEEEKEEKDKDEG